MCKDTKQLTINHLQYNFDALFQFENEEKKKKNFDRNK